MTAHSKCGDNAHGADEEDEAENIPQVAPFARIPNWYFRAFSHHFKAGQLMIIVFHLKLVNVKLV